MTSTAKQPAEDESFSEGGSVLTIEWEVASEEEMRSNSPDALQKALDKDELRVEDVRGELAVGNRRGLDILAELAALKPKYEMIYNDTLQQKGEILQLKGEILELEGRINALEERVDGLSSSLDGYKNLRGRFISTYKHDVLSTATEVDLRIIGAGNKSAHGGDATLDAQLYEGPGGRRDYKAFKSLYGLMPGTVSQISKQYFAMLHAHW
jgi:hypothetical protein